MQLSSILVYFIGFLAPIILPVCPKSLYFFSVVTQQRSSRSAGKLHGPLDRQKHQHPKTPKSRLPVVMNTYFADSSVQLKDLLWDPQCATK